MTPALLEAMSEAEAKAVLDAAVRAREAALCEAAANSTRKPLAKLGKKALYQLRSLGVEVTPTSKPEERPKPVVSEEPEEVPSLVSPIVGNGDRAMVLGRPVRGGVETSQLVLSDERGVVHLEQHELGKGAYRKMLKDAQGGGAKAVAIPLAEAKELLAIAAGNNLRSKTPYPQGLDVLLRHLGLSPLETPAPLPPPLPEDAALAQHGRSLHQEPELSGWLPPIEELHKLDQKIQQIAHSPIQVSEAQRAEQLRAALDQLCKEFFDERVRGLYARRLWQMAAYLERTGRAEPAKIARAEARRLFHAEEPFPSPFTRLLYEKVLALSILQQQQRASAAPQSALTEPGSAEPGTPAGEKRSPGGLILP